MTIRHTLPHLTAAKVASDHPAKNKNRSRGVFFLLSHWASFRDVTVTIMLSPNSVMNSHDVHLRYTVPEDSVATSLLVASFFDILLMSWLPVFGYKQGRGLIIAANGLVIATNRLVATASSVLCIVDGDRVNSLPN